MIDHRAALGLIAAWGSVSAATQPCGDSSAGTVGVESPAYVVAFRTQPATIEIARHFTVELTVCPKGAAPAAEAVRVQGFMPDHGHGMNYQAAVTALGGGRFRAEGLMFHMPGRWELIFDVRAAAKSERLRKSVVLK